MFTGTRGSARLTATTATSRRISTSWSSTASAASSSTSTTPPARPSTARAGVSWPSACSPATPVVVCNLARFSRNFDEGVRVQAELTERGIWLISIQEGINTADENAGARFFRRSMLGNAAFLAESTSEQIRAGHRRARAQDKHIGRGSSMTPDQVELARRLHAEGQPYSAIGRTLGRDKKTIKLAVEGRGAYAVSEETQD